MIKTFNDLIFNPHSKEWGDFIFAYFLNANDFIPINMSINATYMRKMLYITARI